MGGLIGGLALAAPRRDGTAPAAALWAAVLLPVGLLYAYDRWHAPIFVPRYLLFVVPLLCALAGAALAALRLPVALAAVLMIGAVGVPSQRNVRRAHSPFDYRAADRVVRAHQAPGDGIVYAPRGGWQLVDLGMAYYLRDRAPRDLLLAADERATASLWATECADAAACVGTTARVWVVAADDIDRRPGRPPPTSCPRRRKPPSAPTAGRPSGGWAASPSRCWFAKISRPGGRSPRTRPARTPRRKSPDPRTSGRAGRPVG